MLYSNSVLQIFLSNKSNMAGREKLPRPLYPSVSHSPTLCYKVVINEISGLNKLRTRLIVILEHGISVITGGQVTRINCRIRCYVKSQL